MRTIDITYRHCLVFLACFTFVTALQSQTMPVVRIDAYTHSAQQNAPFDRSFYLWLPVDTTLEMDEIDELNLNRVKKKGSKPPIDTIATWLGDELEGTRFIDSVKVPHIKYLQVLVTRQLLPNTRYSVVLFIRASHEYLDSLSKINQLIHDGNLFDAESNYSKLSKAVTVKYLKAVTPIVWPSFNGYLKFYRTNLAPDYDILNAEGQGIDTLLENIGDALDSAGFKISNLYSCNCEKDFVAKELFADSSKFLIPLFNILHVRNMLGEIASGQVNVQEFEPHDRLGPQLVKQRLVNLGLLEASVINISYFFHLSSFAVTVHEATRIAVYDKVQMALRRIDARIKALAQAGKDIRKQIAANREMVSGELSFGNTLPTGQDLQTASGNYFIADFGLALAGTIVNNQYSSVVRPYLGVNVSFLAIDKSQPLSAIQNKRFLHHLSFVMGLTTNSLTRQGTYDLIKNMSVVTGLAYRLSRSFRMTGGVLIYRRDDVNPDLSQPITVGPMLSVSLDLEIAKWFGELKNKLF